MRATTWIAIYAAVVASADVAWQVIGSYLSRRTRLAVSVLHAPQLPAITVTIVNRSSHEVRVQSINLLWEHDGQRDGRMLYRRSAPLFYEGVTNGEASRSMLRATSELPEIVKPYDSGWAAAGGDRLREALPEHVDRICAVVGTADGRVFVAEARTAEERWGRKSRRFRRSA